MWLELLESPMSSGGAFTSFLLVSWSSSHVQILKFCFQCTLLHLWEVNPLWSCRRWIFHSLHMIAIITWAIFSLLGTITSKLWLTCWWLLVLLLIQEASPAVNHIGLIWLRLATRLCRTRKAALCAEYTQNTKSKSTHCVNLMSPALCGGDHFNFLYLPNII